MSLYATTSNEWPFYRFQSHSTTDLTIGGKGDISMGLERNQGRVLNAENRPILRSYKSFPHTLVPSNYSAAHHESSISQATVTGATKEPLPAVSDGESAYLDNTAPIRTLTYRDSTPTSPISGRRSTSVGVDMDDYPDDEDEMLMITGDPEDDIGDGIVTKTAAERRAEKRKMKRFRLTHNQTRFLMSEFARQAHPDAAQRERLSKEIPGLTPRQVQVWFQNRRAKLKRLTSDDRDRMMKSRALPDDFDTTQALHSPFGGAAQPFSTPLASPISYTSTFATDGGIMRPLKVDGLRRQSEDDVTISPLSINSAYGNFYTPPGSIPPSESLSPISPTSERYNLVSNAIPQDASPKSTNPFIRSHSFSTTHHPYPHIPRLQIHDRVLRTRAESLASPLRSSMSYSGNAVDYDIAQASNMGDSLQQNLWETPKCSAFGSTNTAYNPSFPNGLPQGFQSSVLARPRPTITTFPPGLDLRSQYRPLLPMSSFHQAQSLSGFQTAPLAMPQTFPLQQTGTPDQTETIGSSYAVTYGDSQPYSRQRSSDHCRIIEEPTEDRYAVSGLVDASPLSNSKREMAEVGSDAFTLQPAFISGRRRSFTLPNDYNTSLS